MKFVVNKFSMNMFIDSDLLFVRHELSYEEFQALLKGEDVQICIGAEDVAKVLNVECNPQSVHARAGDVLLLAQMNQDALRFYCIQVCKNTHPLLRDEVVEEVI